MNILSLKKSSLMLVMACLFGLTGCEKSVKEQQQQKQQSAANEPAPIVAAPKLNNDATAYANHAYRLMDDVDDMVLPQHAAKLETFVRRPVRQLSTDWRINVKMTDSVTEGQYALCRKALTSLDIWARETAEQGKIVADKQADYLRDKQLCSEALSNPSLGNTDPKMGADRRASSSN